MLSSAFEDKDPVDLVKTDVGCTVKVSLKDESALKPIDICRAPAGALQISYRRAEVIQTNNKNKETL